MPPHLLGRFRSSPTFAGKAFLLTRSHIFRDGTGHQINVSSDRDSKHQTSASWDIGITRSTTGAPTKMSKLSSHLFTFISFTKALPKNTVASCIAREGRHLPFTYGQQSRKMYFSSNILTFAFGNLRRHARKFPVRHVYRYPDISAFLPTHPMRPLLE